MSATTEYAYSLRSRSKGRKKVETVKKVEIVETVETVKKVEGGALFQLL